MNNFIKLKTTTVPEKNYDKMELKLLEGFTEEVTLLIKNNNEKSLKKDLVIKRLLRKIELKIRDNWHILEAEAKEIE